ncbi:hypothetical protein HYE67_003019 [Fusarium culmorum]|uniref:Uncharacterized protein n=1 Tax=Fusarium culmorum TaxID=5516 RepID=A0A2T4GL29_FUSCU|nr:hypothetical protein FCULG_00000058 [Fusarium culmorum]QPC60788.1 hypothetical protein HYE67_003019 [Fusarium culmorum]
MSSRSHNTQSQQNTETVNMSNPVHPFSLTNGTGDIRFTLPGSNQEWTTRIQRPGEGQANNNPSTNTPVERQASRRPQHDMLPQQHGQFVQQPQHGRRPSPTRGSTTYRDNGHHGHGHGHHGQGHHQFNAPPQWLLRDIRWLLQAFQEAL